MKFFAEWFWEKREIFLCKIFCVIFFLFSCFTYRSYSFFSFFFLTLTKQVDEAVWVCLYSHTNTYGTSNNKSTLEVLPWRRCSMGRRYVVVCSALVVDSRYPASFSWTRLPRLFHHSHHFVNKAVHLLFICFFFLTQEICVSKNPV